MIYYNAYKCSRVSLPISCIFIIFCSVIASIYGSTVSIIVSSIMTIYAFEFSFFFLRFVANTVKEAKIEGNTISFVLSNDKQICEKISDYKGTVDGSMYIKLVFNNRNYKIVRNNALIKQNKIDTETLKFLENSKYAGY